MARLVVDAEGGHRSRLAMTGEELAARLLYRDGLMLVIDKPAGIAVHRGPKGGENLEDYFHALRFGLPRNLFQRCVGDRPQPIEHALIIGLRSRCEIQEER
jgi:23S rRNA-/tRNA-specific pseudouridylate synthase